MRRIQMKASYQFFDIRLAQATAGCNSRAVGPEDEATAIYMDGIIEWFNDSVYMYQNRHK